MVHEAYLKLIDITNADWQHRSFFRDIGADHASNAARSGVAAKRGGPMPKVNLDQWPEAGSVKARELIALDDALTTLADIDPRKARAIERRFFGGLSAEETAEVLAVSQTRFCATGG